MPAEVLHLVFVLVGFAKSDLFFDDGLGQANDPSYLDSLDFHYPKIEFLTKTAKPEYEQRKTQNYRPPQTPDASKYRPRPNDRSSRFAKNQTSYRPVILSYVQKVQKPQSSSSKPHDPEDVGTNNRYEEAQLNVSLGTESGANSTGTGFSIPQFLRSYLLKLYSQKYTNSTRPGTYSKVYSTPGSDPNIANDDDNPKSKLIGSLATKIKNKASQKLSLFTIVKFNNTQCNVTNSTGSYLGVCYTAPECDRVGGYAAASCANGYGVCCLVSGTCGGWASQNCSYFQSPNYPDYYPSDGSGGVIVPTTQMPPVTTANPSPTPDPRLTWYLYSNDFARQSTDGMSCTFQIYKSSDDVKRMRIDFLDLELAGPTNGTCVVERLVVTGQDGNSVVPAICGYNTGQHVNVEVSMLTGPLRLSVLSTMTYRKRFSIRVCQYADSCDEASSNCLQYYTGVTGNVSSFNYDQAATLNRSTSGYFNDLNYDICIRREAGYCSVTYTNVRNGVEYPFQLVNQYSNGQPTVPAGMAGVDVLDCPDDYIVIDGVRLCGSKFNDGTVIANSSVNAPVIDTNLGPIIIPVRTSPSATGVGFKLFYTQNRCMT